MGGPRRQGYNRRQDKKKTSISRESKIPGIKLIRPWVIWFDRQEMSQIEVNMSGTHGEWSKVCSDLDSGRVQLEEVLESHLEN